MAKWLKRLALALPVLLLLVAFAAWWLLRGSLQCRKPFPLRRSQLWSEFYFERRAIFDIGNRIDDEHRDSRPLRRPPRRTHRLSRPPPASARCGPSTPRP